MWQPWRWASTSNLRAVENARLASVECSRRRVERAEADAFVAARAADREPVVRAAATAQHLA
ncbi:MULTISPECIES: hypothetical protein [unclassified Nocardioides]|uniref:hypothetical protein n=1 Tax=unclassified Nocardioides TaxID=2615069 RepID=UPI0030142097